MSEQLRIRGQVDPHPYIDQQGRVAAFLTNGDNKKEWALRAGFEVVNGSLSHGASEAEDHFDDFFNVGAVEPWLLFQNKGIYVPYSVHVAASKAQGAEQAYTQLPQDQQDSLQGRVYATGDTTLRMTFQGLEDFDFILNKPNTPEAVQKIMDMWREASLAGAHISYNSGVAMSVFGSDDMRFCTIKTDLGAVRSDVDLAKIEAIVTGHPKVTAGMDNAWILQGGITDVPSMITTTIKEWANGQIIVPENVQTNEPMRQVLNAQVARESHFEVAHDEAVHRLLFGGVARGLIPVM